MIQTQFIRRGMKFVVADKEKLIVASQHRTENAASEFLQKRYSTLRKFDVYTVEQWKFILNRFQADNYTCTLRRSEAKALMMLVAASLDDVATLEYAIAKFATECDTKPQAVSEVIELLSSANDKLSDCL